MRAVLLLLAIAACGGKQPASPTAIDKAKTAEETPAEAAQPDAAEDCSSSIEDAAPGNHDRFAFMDPATDRWGYKNGKGHVVIPPTLEHAYEFKPGGIAAVVDGNAGFAFIGTSGKVIAKAYAFDNGPDYFQEGHARIVDGAKKIGFINDRGQITIPPQFTTAGSFCHGKAEVELGGKRYVIDTRGNTTTPDAPAN